ncbi:prolipoprotein diacylglyceryl transferase [Ruicaihuangia caeni]|uniref:Phosphatidylglycerol--prolipoprotein diacylglyceryl transferase n=1 Tax=Ruicaihuangia caeni TaxID=3042517 RepID=A0AAW6T440_9MICO|nr:prolipoprotein diacylglyceryl transferase [Klugiella sp. YN-L-19]MDI2098094.1 prolipoprotein diacylglyceryl transferase [Klugiella sp. YN-L-19]
MIAPLSIPSPDEAWRVFSFDLFGLQFNIHTYALCILAGIIVATVMTSRRLTKRGAEPGVVLDIALFAVPLGIIGARAYHVLTHPDDYFNGQNPWSAFFIWEGGIAIFGSLIGGAIGAWIGCRMTGIRFWTFADAVAPGILLAQAFGRFGNWFNHELFGVPTDLPWGLEIESTNPAFPVGLPAGTLFHPTFLYEVLWNLAGVALILFLERKYRLQWGRVLGLYLIVYGLGRAWFESIRIDPSEVILGIRVNVWAAFAAIVLGIVIMWVQGRRHPGFEPGPYVPGRVWLPPSAEANADVYSEEDFTATADAAPAELVDSSASGGSAPKA